MLKIREDEDLKELEKFGFKYHKMVYVKEIKRSNETIKEEKIIYVEEENREISIHKGLFNVDEELDTIYDLIKANLVVKVEE